MPVLESPAELIGDVNGANGALDNQIALSDGTSGKRLKYSNVTIDASDNFANVGNVITKTGSYYGLGPALERFEFDGAGDRIIARGANLEIDDSYGLKLSDTTAAGDGVVFKGANAWLHNFHHPTGDTAIPDGRNIFVGENVGNFTVGSTATNTSHGSYLVAIGYNAMQSVTTASGSVAIGWYAMQDTTSGAYNYAIGWYSMRTLSTGSYNIAIGGQALEHIAGGVGNTAVGNDTLHEGSNFLFCAAFGAGALYANTGTGNTAGGYSSLSNLSSGASNTAWGYQSGRFIANGSTALTTATQCVYIGGDTKASADSVTNENVFGYNAIGQGSNTVVIGDASITDTYLQGDVHVDGANAIEFDREEERIEAGTTGYLDHYAATQFRYFSSTARFECMVGIMTGTIPAYLTIADSSATSPLNITERSAAPTSPASSDVYLDDGTNTASGNPGWRRYTGSAWEDISAGGGGGGDFADGGEAGGADRTLGNTDNYDLGFLTNNTNRLHLDRAGQIGFGTGNVAIPLGGVGLARYAFHGTNASLTESPIIQVTTTADNYPLMQWLQYQHNFIQHIYDGFNNGAGYTSSNSAGSYIIEKQGVLRFGGANAGAGSAVSFSYGFQIQNNGDCTVAPGNTARRCNIFDTNSYLKVSTSGNAIFYSSTTLKLDSPDTYTTGDFGVNVASPSSALDVNGDIEVGSSDAMYFGDPTTDGTWRQVRSGNDFVIERRESGSYVEKGRFSA
jgi:hypothetical protein